jgi:hypothetical protein
MFEMQCSGNTKYTRDFGVFVEGETGHESCADVMSVNEVGVDVGDELAASAKGGGNAPRLARREIEIGADDGGTDFAIFGGEAFSVGRERDDDFDA